MPTVLTVAKKLRADRTITRRASSALALTRSIAAPVAPPRPQRTMREARSRKRLPNRWDTPESAPDVVVPHRSPRTPTIRPSCARTRACALPQNGVVRGYPLAVLRSDGAALPVWGRRPTRSRVVRRHQRTRAATRCLTVEREKSHVGLGGCEREPGTR